MALGSVTNPSDGLNKLRSPRIAYSSATTASKGGFSMFARSVSMHLKPNTLTDFNRTLENDVLPLLRKQKGFQDELVLVAPNAAQAVGISLWDNKENAEAYQKDTYPEVQRLLSRVIEGTAQVKTYEVPLATFHKVAARGG